MSFERLVSSLLFLALIVAAALTPMQHDTWWQLRAGGDMWSSWRVVLTDTYSHTAFGAFWPNHEWLAEVIYYACYRAGGLALVTLLATALVAGAWWISWRLMVGPARVRVVLTALAFVPSSLHWEPRPHAFSFLFLMIAVYCLVHERYMWLPLVFAVWANCHGGVLTGLVVVSAGLLAPLILSRDGWLRRAMALCGCAIGATVTPLGLAMWTELPKSLARIRQYPLNEWQPPTFGDPRLAPFWIIAVVLCVLIVNRLKRYLDRDHPAPQLSTLTLCVCAMALLPLAATAVRNVGLFLMVAVPAVTVLWPPSKSQPVSSPHERRRLNLALATGAAAIAAIGIAWAYEEQIAHLQWTPLPAASVAALGRCPGNLYNRYDEGGYLIWFAPEKRVFLDGRQDPYEPSLVLEQIRIEHTGDYAATFSRYHIQCAFLPTSSPVAERLAAASWTPLYRDSSWIVFTSHTDR
jgi:hypothetical protein